MNIKIKMGDNEIEYQDTPAITYSRNTPSVEEILKVSKGLKELISKK